MGQCFSSPRHSWEEDNFLINSGWTIPQKYCEGISFNGLQCLWGSMDICLEAFNFVPECGGDSKGVSHCSLSLWWNVVMPWRDKFPYKVSFFFFFFLGYNFLWTLSILLLYCYTNLIRKGWTLNRTKIIMPVQSKWYCS